MKIVLLCLIGVTCASCAHLPPYVQNGIFILPPVKQEVDSNGNIVEQEFNDGGTRMIRITDAKGILFDVYIDHRIGKEKGLESFYINGYPGSSSGVRIIDS